MDDSINTAAETQGNVMTWKSATDLIEEAKQRIKQVTPSEAMQMSAKDPSIVYLDCREPAEWNLGHIPGAVFIPRGDLESHVEAKIPRDTKIIIYCARGNRSALAADTMQQMGYEDVASMSQGIIGWVDAGGEIED
jgi:sulfur-carrier protein adenylyltransferase/sulfurtransferase